MKINAARQFILKNARPIDLAVYKYFFENGSNQRVIDELSKFQNEDGGFDIWWKWYTPYSEFEQARKYWRPRVTIDKLLFVTGE